jgi:hypothetical protein
MPRVIRWHDRFDVCFVLWDFLNPTHENVGFWGRSVAARSDSMVKLDLAAM